MSMRYIPVEVMTCHVIERLKSMICSVRSIHNGMERNVIEDWGGSEVDEHNPNEMYKNQHEHGRKCKTA